MMMMMRGSHRRITTVLWQSFQYSGSHGCRCLSKGNQYYFLVLVKWYHLGRPSAQGFTIILNFEMIPNSCIWVYGVYSLVNYIQGILCHLLFQEGCRRRMRGRFRKRSIGANQLMTCGGFPNSGDRRLLCSRVVGSDPCCSGTCRCSGSVLKANEGCRHQRCRRRSCQFPKRYYR